MGTIVIVTVESVDVLCVLQADAEASAAAASNGAVQAIRQRVRSSQDGSAPRQRELTWTLFEGMWKHKYERERKDPTKIDPKLIYQVSSCLHMRFFVLYVSVVAAVAVGAPAVLHASCFCTGLVWGFA
jgi:hypothetical protein